MNQKGFVLIAVLVAIGAIFIFFGIWHYRSKMMASPTASSQTEEKPLVDQSVASSSIPDESSWKTYDNARGGYIIRYPSDASIAFIDEGNLPSRCVMIRYGLEYVELNNGASLPCSGSTGVGIGDQKATDTLSIFNMRYGASGFREADNSFSFLGFPFTDDVWVTYGVDASAGSSTTITDQQYMAAMDDVKFILYTLARWDPSLPNITSRLLNSNKEIEVTFSMPKSAPAGRIYATCDPGLTAYFSDTIGMNSTQSPNICNTTQTITDWDTVQPNPQVLQEIRDIEFTNNTTGTLEFRLQFSDGAGNATSSISTLVTTDAYWFQINPDGLVVAD